MTALERLADLRANVEHLAALLAERQVDEAPLLACRSGSAGRLRVAEMPMSPRSIRERDAPGDNGQIPR